MFPVQAFWNNTLECFLQAQGALENPGDAQVKKICLVHTVVERFQKQIEKNQLYRQLSSNIIWKPFRS